MKKIKKNEEPFASHLYFSLKKIIPIEKKQCDLILRFCTMRRFDKKHILVDIGGMENHLNLVVKGLVRKYVKAERGESTLQLACEGQVIYSEISFLRRVHSPVIIETLEPTILISIQYMELQRILNHFTGAEALARKFMEAMFTLKDERMYKKLSLTPRERFLEFTENNTNLLQRVPQKILASYLDIKPETYSRMKHLIKQSN